MKCHAWPLAVCSWSLRTDLVGVVVALRQLGIDRVNLALKPVLAEGGVYGRTLDKKQSCLPN